MSGAGRSGIRPTSPATTGTSSDTCRHTTQPADHDRDVFRHVPAYDPPRRRQPRRLPPHVGIRPTSPAATGTSSHTCRHTTHLAGGNRDVFPHMSAYDPALALAGQDLR